MTLVSKRRWAGPLAGAGAWLVAAATAAGVAWAAVSFVGQQVTDDAPAPLSQEAIAHAIAAATPPPETPGTAQPPSPTPDTRTPSTPRAEPTKTPDARTPRPEPAAPRSKARKPGNGRRATGPGQKADTRARPSTVTFMVSGGTVAVRCSESENRLLYATPANGWRVRVGSVGPTLVDVTFTRDGRTPSNVSAKCGNVVDDAESHRDERDD
jgi:hypothetical protein